MSKIVICISDVSKDEKKRIFVELVNAVVEAKAYLFEVCGVDAQTFLEDIGSHKRLLIEDVEHKFIKELPIAFAISKKKEDIQTFCEYIGQFNEGYMCLYILSSEFEVFDKQQILKSLKEKILLMIDVTDDGEMLEVSCKSEKIKNFIKKMKDI